MIQISDIQTIGVIGSGVMGHGIATVAAQNGYKVCLYDLNQTVLDKARTQIEQFTQVSVDKGKATAENRAAILNRIQYSLDLEEQASAQVIVEATPENLSLKHELFQKLEKIVSPQVILATNTSSIPVTQIAAVLQNAERCIGWHFFNPAPMMKLVEVIPAVETSAHILNLTVELTRKMGKTPAVVQDTPGFIVNRVARFYYLESLRMAEENTADFETIDQIMEATGFKMGPFKLMDLIGVETNHEVSKSLYHSFYEEPRFRPSRIQQKKVEARHYGRKTKRGFYTY